MSIIPKRKKKIPEKTLQSLVPTDTTAIDYEKPASLREV